MPVPAQVIIHGSAFALPLADGSVHTIITSPPYFSLRKYSGLPALVLGGDPKCEHRWNEYDGNLNHENRNNLRGTQEEVVGQTGTAHIFKYDKFKQGFCSCGAWRGDFGLEPTVELYIEHSMLVLRECWRVLRSDGVMFWNISDSYSAASTHKAKVPRGGYNQRGRSIKDEMDFDDGELKPKDLCLVPQRFAIAAQAQGWFVRSEIIWKKNNPMPESVTDRPTSSHETIWMLTKSPKYWWDAEAVREKAKTPGSAHVVKNNGKGTEIHDTINPTYFDRTFVTTGNRNLRNVWSFPTSPYPEAHFATFPEELPRRCILAACPEKTCGKCGKGWVRILDKTGRQITGAMKIAGCDKDGKYSGTDLADYASGGAQSPSDSKRSILESMATVIKTIGWKPSCECGSEETGKGICLDPFAGTFCTVEMAMRANRVGIGIELSKDYLKLGKKRLAAVQAQGVLI